MRPSVCAFEFDLNTYNPSTPTEGGNLFLQTAFGEQNHSKKFVGVIRVNPFVDFTPKSGGKISWPVFRHRVQCD